MKIKESIGIIISNGKAYIPTNARTSVGYFGIKPVTITNATETDLEFAIKQAKDQGNPILSDEQLAEARKQKFQSLIYKVG